MRARSSTPTTARSTDLSSEGGPGASSRGRFLMGLLAAYFGCIAILAAVLSMRHGAGGTVVGFVEVLLVIALAGLCFGLAWVLARPYLRAHPLRRR